MSRKSATTSRPPIAAFFASLERVLAERGRDVGLLELIEVDRQGARLEHEREVLRLADVTPMPVISAPLLPGDAVRVVVEVDRTERT